MGKRCRQSALNRSGAGIGAADAREVQVGIHVDATDVATEDAVHAEVRAAAADDVARRRYLHAQLEVPPLFQRSARRGDQALERDCIARLPRVCLP